MNTDSRKLVRRRYIFNTEMSCRKHIVNFNFHENIVLAHFHLLVICYYLHCYCCTTLLLKRRSLRIVISLSRFLTECLNILICLRAGRCVTLRSDIQKQSSINNHEWYSVWYGFDYLYMFENFFLHEPCPICTVL